MMKRGLLISFVFAASALAGPLGYVINFSGQFGLMDLATGSFNPLGPGVPSNSAGGLAGAPGGPFFSTDAAGHVQRFSPNGTVQDIGDTGTGDSTGPNGISVVGGLTTGSVFALDFSNRLFRVNTSNAALSLLGTLALPAQEQQYDGNMTTSFNGDGSYMYYTIDVSSGPNAVGPELFRIDPITLQIISLPVTGLQSRLIGSGFVEGIFYGFTDAGEIYQIQKSTGVATLTATYDSGIPPGGGPPFTGVFGAVGTPEPGTALLLGLGLFGIGLGCRRRRA